MVASYTCLGDPSHLRRTHKHCKGWAYRSGVKSKCECECHKEAEGPEEAGVREPRKPEPPENEGTFYPDDESFLASLKE